MKALLTILLSVFCCSITQAQSKKYQIAAGISATVNHTPGTKTVQVLMPGVETIELDLTQPANNTFLIKTADYNFDGFKDFALASKDAAPNAPTVYDIYLYHPADKSFEALDVPGGVCEIFGNVRISAGDKTLRSSCKGALHGSTDIYRWDTPFSLTLVKSIDNSTDAEADKTEDKMDKKDAKKDLRDAKKEGIQDKKDTRKDKKDDDDQ